MFSYLGTDGLGSTTVAFDAAGTPRASQLYAPYGGVRYSIGSMPDSCGFTGQHSYAATRVDYYNARYYDPVAGQFTSADTILPGDGADPWGFSRYAYVEGNPLIRVDPTGHGGDGARSRSGGDLRGHAGEGVGRALPRWCELPQKLNGTEPARL